MTKKQVEALIKKHKKAMGLSLWDIRVELMSDSLGSNREAACIYQNRRYMWASIKIYKDAFKKPNDINHIIVHELCHLITEPLFEYCYDFLNGRFVSPDTIDHEREKMTEHIARIYRGLLDV